MDISLSLYNVLSYVFMLFRIQKKKQHAFTWTIVIFRLNKRAKEMENMLMYV